jgi:OOP family OmpA-OmpF porin
VFTKCSGKILKIHILIQGYTARGDEHRNVLLSNQRAVFVKRYLVKQGIQGNRIKAAGLGSSAAIFQNDTEENIARSRCAEIFITAD